MSTQIDNIKRQGRRWLSPLEISVYLNCHVMSVYAWIAAGKIPAARVGRLVRVDFFALQAALEHQSSGQPAVDKTKGRGR